jgi:Ca-activated chloride channel homolog
MKKRWLIVLLILMTAGGFSAASQTPMFSVNSEEVRIDMLVTDKDKPILGLTASDFEVRDNGVIQKIASLNFEQIPVSLTMIFDMSSSIYGRTLSDLKSAGNALLDRLKKDDRAALIKFSQTLGLGFPLTRDIARVKVILNDAQPELISESSLIDACYSGLVMAESKENRALIVVFSDGLDTSSWLTGQAVIESAKRGNSVVYAVSASNLWRIARYRSPEAGFIEDLTKCTGGSLLEIKSTKELSDAFLRIIEEFRQRYLLTYSPEGVSDSGWHRLEIRVKNRRAKIQTRSGYRAGRTEP